MKKNILPALLALLAFCPLFAPDAHAEEKNKITISLLKQWVTDSDAPIKFNCEIISLDKEKLLRLTRGNEEISIFLSSPKIVIFSIFRANKRYSFPQLVDMANKLHNQSRHLPGRVAVNPDNSSTCHCNVAYLGGMNYENFWVTLMDFSALIERWDKTLRTGVVPKR